VNAFITGVTGFVGTYLAEHLLDCGDRVVGSFLGDGWPDDTPDTVVQNVKLVPWDISQPAPDAVCKAFASQPPDCVYHLAAVSVPRMCGRAGSGEPNEVATRINVEGTRHVAELVGGLHGQPRLFFVSSSAVYAPVDRRSPVVDELAAVDPLSGYGKTKLAAEQIVLDAVNHGGLDAVVVRAFQHTGPRQEPLLMLPEWTEQFARQADPVQVRCLESYLDLTDVRDVVRAYRLLAERGKRGTIYNVGSGQSHRSGDILSLLQKVSGFQPAIVVARKGPDQNAIANIDRMVKDTAWQPEIALEQTVADTWTYWRNRRR